MPASRWLATAAVGLAIVLAGVASTPHERPAAIATVEPLPPPAPAGRPLPEVAADARTLQLAKQARTAALQVQCTTVRVLVEQIRERDYNYAVALASAGVVAPCL